MTMNRTAVDKAGDLYKHLAGQAVKDVLDSECRLSLNYGEEGLEFMTLGGLVGRVLLVENINGSIFVTFTIACFKIRKHIEDCRIEMVARILDSLRLT